MIPPPRDAVIHQLARTAAEKIEAGHGQLDNFDSAVQIIEAALLQVRCSKCGYCEAKEAENTSKAVVK